MSSQGPPTLAPTRLCPPQQKTAASVLHLLGPAPWVPAVASAGAGGSWSVRGPQGLGFPSLGLPPPGRCSPLPLCAAWTQPFSSWEFILPESPPHGRASACPVLLTGRHLLPRSVFILLTPRISGRGRSDPKRSEVYRNSYSLGLPVSPPAHTCLGLATAGVDLGLKPGGPAPAHHLPCSLVLRSGCRIPGHPGPGQGQPLSRRPGTLLGLRGPVPLP